MHGMNIKDDKILYESVKHVCKDWGLDLVHYLDDHVGKYAAILKDPRGRRYLFACKRRIFFQKNAPGIISFTKSLIQDAETRQCQLMMLIQDADAEGAAKNYVYVFNPKEILTCPEGFDNEFNDQIMRNFPIWYAVNMDPTRRREWTEIHTQFKAGKKEKAELKVTRNLNSWTNG